MRGNLRQCAKFNKVSVPTMWSWIDQGAPVIRHGRSGRPYVLDFEAIDAWRDQRETEAKAAAAARQALLAAAGVSIFGNGSSTKSQTTFSSPRAAEEAAK